MSLFRDRRIALLVAGQAVNAIGSWCALVAIWGYATFQFHAGPSEIALLGLAWALPPFLLGPIAGLPVDRFGPKWALIVADSAAAVVALLFIFAGSFEALVVLAAIDGVTKSFAEPAFQALPPRLVGDHQLAAANGMLATASQSAIAFGPLLASASIALFGFEGAFVVDAITFLIGVAVLVPFRIGPIPRTRHDAQDTSVIGEFREGLRVIAARPKLRRLMLLAVCCYLIWGAFIVVEPLYVREVLHGTPTTFALLQTTFGVALLAAGIVVTRLGDRAVRWSLVCAATMASGVGAAVYVGTRIEAVAFVGMVCWGAVTACFIAPLRTLMQRAAPVAVHGRVFAMDGSLHSLGDLVSLPLIGLAVAAVGVQVAGVSIAVVPVVGGGLIWLRSRGNAADDALGVDLDGNSLSDAVADPAVAMSRA